MSTTEKYIDGRRWLSAKEAASVLKMSRDHITRLCRSGKVTAQQIEKVWYVDEASLHAFLLLQDRRKEEQAAELQKLRAQEYQQHNGISAPKLPTLHLKIFSVPVLAAVALALMGTGTAFALSASHVSLPQKVAAIGHSFESLVHPSSTTQAAATADTQTQTQQPPQTTSNAPVATGTPAHVGGTDVPRPDFSANGVLQVNAPLNLSKSLTVLGTGSFESSIAAGLLQVHGGASVAGSLSAFGGITTGGADINAGNGRVFASNILNGIKAGTNVTITGPASNPTISVTIPQQQPLFLGGGGGGGGSGTVTSVTAGTGLSGGTITGAGTLSLNLASANTWTALQTFAKGLAVNSGAFVVSGTNVGVGTTSPFAQFSIEGTASSTTIFAIASSTGTTLFSISNAGTTTAANGVNITNGCFAVNGSCISSGSNFIGGGTAGEITYYAANGNAVTATSSIFISPLGNFGVGTTSPYAKFAVAGQAVAQYFTATSMSKASTFPLLTATTATTSNLALTSATSTLLKTNILGQIVPAIAGTDYATAGSIAGFANWHIVNGYLTPTTTIGVLVNASSTIGNGTQAGGLTISGGATTTGNAYFASKVGIGVVAPTHTLDVAGTGKFTNTLTLANLPSCTGGEALQTDGLGNVICSAITAFGSASAGGWSTDLNGHVYLATTTDKVGVGTTTSYAKLSVVSTANKTTLALVPATGQTADILDIFNTTGALSSVFTADGKLGLGTTSPSQVLSVQGKGLFSGGITTGGILAVNGTGTSTFAHGLQAASLKLTGSATSTAANGFNITNGCYAIGGNCLTIAGLGGIASIGTGIATTSGSNIVLASSTTGSDFSISAAGSKITFNLPTASALARGLLSSTDFASFNNKISSSSLSANAPLHYNSATGVFTIDQATAAQNGYLSSADFSRFNGKLGSSTIASLTNNSLPKWDNTNKKFVNSLITDTGTNVGIGTSTPGAALAVEGSGLFSGSIRASSFNLTGSATSTAANGFDISGGCYAIDGSCLTLSGLGGVSGSGAANRVAYFSNSTALTSNANFTFVNENLGLGTTTPYARLSVAGQIVGQYFTATSTTQTNTFPLLTATTATTSNLAVTSVTSSILKTNSLGQLIAAVAGTDYAPATSGSSLLYGNGAGGFTSATVSGPLSFSGGTLSITKANTSTNGYLSSTDFTLFNNKISSSSLSASAPLHYNSATGAFTIDQATAAQSGYLSSINFTKFNSKISSSSLSAGTGISYSPTTGVIANTGVTSVKQSSGTTQTGALVLATSSQTTNGQTVGLNITNTSGTFTFKPTLSGTLAVAGGGTGSTTLTGLLVGNGTSGIQSATVSGPLSFSGSTLSIAQATAAQNGYLSSADFTTFNGKLGSSTISGLSNNFIPKWNGSAFGNSVIAQTNNNIGIGTSSPYAKLSVAGQVVASYFTATSTATSTFGGGIHITSGCFELSDGTCLEPAGSGSGSGIGGSGAANRVAFFSDGFNVTSNAGFVFANNKLGIGTSTPFGVVSINSDGITGPAFVVGSSSKTAFEIDNGGSTIIPTIKATTGNYCLQVDANGKLTNTGAPCGGTGGSGTGILQIGPAGQLQNGSTQTLATSSLDTASGLSDSLTITGSSNTLTFTPTLTGTLNVTHGGTGSTTLTGLLVGNGTSGIQSAAISGPLAFSGGTLSITKANTSTNGYLSSTDFALFNNKISSSSLSASAPLHYNSTTGAFTIDQATAAQNGYLSSADFTTFNGKLGSSTISGLSNNFIPQWNGSAFGNSVIAQANNNIGIGTSSPFTKFSVAGSGYFAGNLTASNLIATGTATTSNLAITSLTSKLLKTNGLGQVVAAVAGVDYATPGSLSSFANWHIVDGYLTPTSTIGILVNASSTIGNGTEGLTINGNATTTGNAHFSGKATINGALTLNTIMSCSGSDALQTDANGKVVCGPIASLGVSTAGGWSTDNTGSVFLATSTDSAGVGTTSPYAKLSVESTSAASTTLALVPHSGQTANIIDIYNTSGALSSVFTANGKLGIGTTSPAATLAVNGNTYLGGNLTVTGNLSLGNFNEDATLTCGNKYHTFIGPVGTVGGDECAALNVTQKDVNGNVIYRFGEANGTWAGEFFANATLVGLNTKTSVPIEFLINGVEKARINNDGNFGIGTTSPYAKLSVAGQAVAQYFTATSTTQTNTFPLLTATTATTSKLAVTSVTSSLLKTNSLGQLVAAVAGTDYQAAGNYATFGYLFPSNATSTKLSFMGGLLSLASTTIGNGTQTGGLTVSGGATTTGNAYFGGDINLASGNNVSSKSINGTNSLELNDGGKAVLSLGTGSLAFEDGGGNIKANIAVGSGNSYFKVGNVGIGTSSPSAPLSVSGNAYFADDVGIGTANPTHWLDVHPGATGNAVIGRVSLGGNSGSTALASLGYFTKNGNTDYGISFDSSGNTGLNGASRITFSLGGTTEEARLDSTGNFGIGTTSPYAKLSVAGQIVGAYFTATSTATSTFGGGIHLTSGCFEMPNGTCLSPGGSGTITAVGPTGQQVTSGAVALASSTDATTGLTSGITITGSGSTITFKPTLSGTLAIAHGGTNNTSFTSNGVAYYNGTKLTNSSNLTFNGTTLTAAKDISVNGITVGEGAGAKLTDTVLGNGALPGDTSLSPSNTAIGYQTLHSNTSGTYNTANGYSALYANTTGSGNSANGYLALYANTTGSSNTANGIQALQSNTSGSYNTANGVQALNSNTTGSYNTANGYSSLTLDTTGSANIATGYNALFSNTTGFFNTALGYNAAQKNTVGTSTTLLGAFADASANNLSTSTAIGAGALVGKSNALALGGLGKNSVFAGVGTTSPFARFSIQANANDSISNKYLFAIGSSTASATTTLFSISNTGSTTASNGFNITAGCFAVNGTCVKSASFSYLFPSNATSTKLTFSGGLLSLASTTIGNGTQTGGLTINGGATTTLDMNIHGLTVGEGKGSATSNTAVGVRALSTNTTGTDNTANGYHALYSNTSGTDNTANGFFALVFNTTGSKNVANGVDVLFFNSTGSDNTGNGYGSLYSNSTGSNNTANGYIALYHNTAGSYNTATGYEALSNNKTGSFNAAFGYNAGLKNTIGTSTTLLGAFADATANNLSTSTAIGAGALVGKSNALALGGLGKNSVFAGVGTTSPFARFSIQANPTDSVSNKYLFAIGSSTASATTTLFSISNTGSTTASNGINITNGCFAVNGMCISASSVTHLGSGFATTSSQNIVFSTSTDTTTGLTDALTITATTNGLHLAPSLSGTLAIVHGGTNASSFTSNGVAYYDGTKLTNSSSLTFNGTTLTAANDASIHGITVGEGAGSVNVNTAVGNSALSLNTSGSDNTAYGYQTLKSNTTGSDNTASGYEALRLNTGSKNTANGSFTLNFNSSGSNNVADGYAALFVNTIGSNNTADGWESLFGNKTGYFNSAFGYSAGKKNTVGTSTTLLGAFADASANNLSTSTAIGAGAIVGCSDCLVLGGTGANAVNVGIGTSTPLATLDVNGSIRGNSLVLTSSSTALSTLNSFGGFNGYINASGGLGTGGTQYLSQLGNLINLNNIQGGSLALSTGGTFATKVDYTTGSSPRLVAVGDFNGDGKPDYVVANSGVSSVSVFINKGDGTFATKVDYTVGTSPQGLAVGDVNGDGKPDIVAANYTSGTISVLINNGNGTFASKVDYTTGSGPNSVAIGDLNGDGMPDIAVANFGSNTVSVFLNKGNGTFASKVDYTTETSPQAVAMADFNGDGKPDLVVANNGSNDFSYFINKGTGAFYPKISFTTGTTPQAIAVGDLNGDGKPDVVTADGGSNKVSVFLNANTGSSTQFASKVDYTTGTDPFGVTIGDFNGDGKMDIAAANGTSNSVSVLLNNGSGTFAFKVDYTTASSPRSLAAADFNGDGKQDIVTSDYSGNLASVLINNASSLLYASAGSGATSGAVGVGTSSPFATFSVQGNSATGNNAPAPVAAAIYGGTGGTASTFAIGGQGGSLIFTGGLGGSGGTGGTGGAGGDLLFSAGAGNSGPNGNGNGGNVYITGGSSGGGTSRTGNVLLGINSSGTAIGNVGIGVTSPSSRLDIVNSATSSAIITLRDVIGNDSLEIRAGTSTLKNTAIGVSALAVNTTGSDNAAFGNQALKANTTGQFNTANGYQALLANTTGTRNTANGATALSANTTGAYNTADGIGALALNTTGSNNVANGASALFFNTHGSFNAAFGYEAGLKNTIGTSTTLLGAFADASANNLSTSTAIGAGALVGKSNAIAFGGLGKNSVFAGIGTSSPFARFSIQANPTDLVKNKYLFAIGSSTAKATSTLFAVLNNGRVGIGTASPSSRLDITNSATSSPIITLRDPLGNDSLEIRAGTSTLNNTAIGYQALQVNTTGVNNIALGNQTLQSNTTGGNNVALGYLALQDNTTGVDNISIGKQALSRNTTGSQNVANGSLSLFLNTTGSNNVANGFHSLELNTTGSDNVGIGYNSFFNQKTGFFNTALGYNAGQKNTVGTSTTLLGAFADASANNLSTSTAIGAGAIVGCSDCLVLGGTGKNAVNVGIGTSTPLATLDVNGSIRGNSLVLTSSSTALSTLNSFGGFSGYINASGGLGTGGTQYLSQLGNLINLNNIQGGSLALSTGGTLATKVDYTAGTEAISVVLSDVNGDGKPDLIEANFFLNNISIYLNKGDGTFNTTPVNYTTGTNPRTVAIGDLNGDGKPDLVTVNNGSNTVSVFINNGNGTFASKVDYATGSGPFGVTIGDFNGDGKPDLAVTNFSAGSVSIFLNKGNGTFASKVDYTTGVQPRFIVAKDFNGDGTLDLAVANYGSNTVSVLAGKGDGTFYAKTDFTTGTGPFGLAAGDLNGDGKPDLAVTNYTSDTVSVFLNTDSGSTTPKFATKVDYTTGTTPLSVAVGDLNGDGKQDLAVGNSDSSTVSVFLNKGSGTFASKVDYATGATPYSVALGDLNSDGRLDLATANFDANSVSVLLNNASSLLYASAGTGTSSGAVGIGTSTPWGLLSVNPNGITGPAFVIGSSTKTDFVVTNSGKIGIGTSSPYADLSFGGSSDAKIAAGTSPLGTALGLTLAAGSPIGSNKTGGTLTLSAGASTGVAASQIVFKTAIAGASLGAVVNPLQTTAILSGGNFGVGTTSPFARLSIQANSVGTSNKVLFAIGSSTASATTTLFSISNTGSTTASNGINITNGCFAINGTCLSAGGSGTINSGTAGQLAYYKTNGTGVSGTSTIFIASNGRVGVGTSTPSAAFAVNGSVYANNFTAGSSSATSTFKGGVLIGGHQAYASASGLAVGNGYPTNIGKLIAGTDDLALGAGDIHSTGTGSIAFGNGDLTDGGSILSSGNGSFAGGYSNINNVTASGDASFAFGDNVVSSNTLSFSFGSGFTNSTANTFKVGYSSTPTLTVNATSVGIGTTTPRWKLEVAATSSPQLALSDGSLTSSIWTFRNAGGDFFLATSSPSTFATSTSNVSGIFEIDKNGNFYLGTTTTNIKYQNNLKATTTIATNLNVDNSLTFNSASGQTTISNLQVGQLNFPSDAGTVAWVNLPISSAAVNTKESYTAQMGGQDVLTIFGLSNGSGGVNATTTAVGIGTTTPYAFLAVQAPAGQKNAIFEVASSSGSQYLTVTNKGKLGVGTSSPLAKLAVQATAGQTNPIFEVASSSNATKFLSVAGTGFGTTTVTGLNIKGSATTTSNVGINITSGCFAVNGSCITGTGGTGGSGTVNSGTAGQLAYYKTNGTAVSGTSTLFLASNRKIGIGTTTPYAALTIQNTGATSSPVLAFADPLGKVSLEIRAGTSTLDNTAVGAGALAVNTTGNDVTAFGKNALTLNTTGLGNTGIGAFAMETNTTGQQNTGIGAFALDFNSTGSTNSGVGYGALEFNETGSDNTATGYFALQNNVSADGNTADGVKALQSNLTGSFNTASGYEALINMLSGAENVAIGDSASWGLNQGTSTVAIGAGIANGNSGNITGFTAVGTVAGFSLNTGADYNTLIGYGAGSHITTGANNIFLGADSTANGVSFADGSKNTLTTGSNNISIGYNITLPSSTGSNQLDIGNLIYGTGLNGTGTTLSTGKIGIGTTTPGSTLTVAGSLCVAKTSGGTGCSSATTAGEIYADSSSLSGGFDLAETYPTTDLSVGAGDVVAFDTASSTAITKASTSAATFLGVVSTKPGLTLGVLSTSTRAVALSGRVPVKVSLQDGPIAVGDRLTISSTPGVAMKAVGDGPTLGIALQSYTATSTTASNTILVFVQPQYSFSSLSIQTIEALASSTATSTAQSQNIFATIFNGIKTDIANWLADATNGINKLFAGEVDTNQLCIKNSSGSNVCVTGDQLAALLAGKNAGTTSTQMTTASTTTSKTSTSTAPVISINGNNPAQVSLGAKYNDLGATITGPQQDLNLGIKAIVDGGATTTLDQISIDTSKAGMHTIKYVAIDQNGLEGSATRTVEVSAAGTTGTTTTSTATSTTATSTPSTQNDTSNTQNITFPNDAVGSTTPTVTDAASSTPTTDTNTTNTTDLMNQTLNSLTGTASSTTATSSATK